MEALKIGLWSGFFYPVDGYRKGLWDEAAEIFKEEGVRFTVYAGGLVDQRRLVQELRERIARARREKIKDLAAVREEYIDRVVNYLVENFPSLGVKTYLITSPTYDGELGEEVARRLAERRREICHYRRKEQLPIKQCKGKLLGVYTAEKAPWRGDYFDTPVVRVLKDERKRSPRGLGDYNIVGPFGSAVFNPGDASDVKKPYASLPLLCKPNEVRTSENQFGIRILEIDTPNLKEALISTYSFKDLISEEWSFVNPPPESTDLQRAIVNTIAEKGSMTIGVLEDTINRSRNVLTKEIEELMKRKRTSKWPGLELGATSKKYGFKQGWFQERLSYPAPKVKDLTEESFVAFGCLHAGCKWTDMKFFRDEVPKYLVKYNIQYFVGAGDFIEGLKHDLILKGEVVSRKNGPANYTFQERLSAYLVGKVLLGVFETRSGDVLQGGKGKKLEARDVEELIEKSLPTFVFKRGNHCGWTAPLGFDSLSTFAPTLKRMVLDGVMDKLFDAGVSFPIKELRRVMKKKIVNIEEMPDSTYMLPSGLKLNIYHPEMSRTKTPSIRPQEMLEFSDSNIVIGANFHTAESVSLWDAHKGGQRVCLQVGTLKTKSGFEDGKLKIVDFGVGMLKVHSLPPNWIKDLPDRRIFKDQVAFFGEKKSPDKLMEDNATVLNDFEKEEENLR